MKTTALLAALASFCLLPLAAHAQDFATLKDKAEGYFAEGSYAKAHEVYDQTKELKLSAADRRWVDFRSADTLWRSQAATQNSDSTQLDQARKALEVLVRDINRVEDHDRIWAEVEESLGDYFWARRDSHDWGSAWPHYSAALDWWAGAANVELARTRYVKLVWRVAKPANSESYYYYGYYGQMLPVEILDSVVKIAQSENDKAHAHYLIAMTLRNQGGDWDQLVRVPEEFEGAIKSGKTTEWYDDALFNYAQWLENNGRAVPMKDGGWRQEPDFDRALELYRKLTGEFKKGETRYYDQAEQRIKDITGPSVSVALASIFLPDSEIQYQLNWRNIRKVQLALYPVDLTRDVQLAGEDDRNNNWLQSIDLTGRKATKTWSRDTKDAGHHRPGFETVRLEGKLPVGAYVLEATAGDKHARDLLLVTDTAIVLKTSGKQALVYVCDALAGAPVADTSIHLWERYYENNHWHWRDASKTANGEGIAVFDLERTANNEQLFVAANAKGRQAFDSGNSGYYRHGREETWRIYAFTDRPAYRPGETVQWKFIARQYDGSVYSTPAEQVVEYEIYDARGAKVKEDKVTLNAFGTAWASLELKDTMPLGACRVVFHDSGKRHQIGGANLFRLEEYKLPEFKVSVQMPEENGHKKAFRLGEKVEVNIQADYYFGGGVANADVEVVVTQNPLYHYWHQPHDYAWFYDDMSEEYSRGRYWGGGQGQVIKREKLKTDASGKASLTFETPRNQGQDLEYRIEARVTDASRREIIGNGTARVTRQRYYVYPQAAHNLYRPQDKVSLEFKAQDANEQPVQTEGTVRVTRDYWYEIWIDPKGKEVKGDELKRWQSCSVVFPPPPLKPEDRGWQLKFRGYEHDDILTRTLKTDTNGMAELTFTPEREGYYRVAWTSKDTVKTNARPEPPIKAETTVWVATSASTELGYRHGGMEIIVDKDTFRVGEKAPVMLSVPTNDRYVLFSVEGEDLYSYQLIHVTGTVKLVELPIEEKHVPNIFLNAAMVSDRQIFTDTKQVIVPPTKNFLTVDVKSDREQYQPHEEGTFTITTRNDRHEPVSAEVAFGLVDESVFYIQSDYAGDPRQFYFGQKRSHQIQTGSTFNQKSYAKLVEGDDHALLDIRDREQTRREGRSSSFYRLNGEYKDRSVMTDAFDEDGLANRLADKSEGGRPNVYFSTRQATFGGAVEMTKMVNSAVAPMSPAPVAAPAGVPPGEEPTVQVQVRSDFRSTVFWQPDVITGKDGKATVKVTYPDSLTGWKATARAATEGNQFGIADATTHTKQPLIVRLEAPRFFLVGDEVVISAVVNNNTATPMEAKIILETQDFQAVTTNAASVPILGNLAYFSGGKIHDGIPTVQVPANGEARVDWTAHVDRAGGAKLKVTARDGKYADAMEKTYTVYEHGIEKFISKSGKVRGDDVTVKLNLPKERKAGSTSLIVQVTPSMAVTMLDALPYLIDYPYGCTEQTMSRFLPAAITAKTLKDEGLKPEDVMGRVFGGIETNSAAATHPKGKHDLHELDDITEKSLKRLYDFQHADGGWGWWKEGDSDHFMTAYVVWGLSLARGAGIETKAGVLRRGAEYLDKTLVDEEQSPDEQAWMLHALSVYEKDVNHHAATAFQAKAFDNLWKNRDQLNAYTRALLALSAHNFGYADKAKTLVENLENGVKRDNKPDTSVVMQAAQQSSEAVIGTAHWGEDGVYWRWSEGGVEATAFALRALLAIDPQNKLIEPVSNWLIKNRRGAQWSNTRDTAIVVLTMNDYLRVSGELSPDLEYELLVNGQSIATKKVSGAEVFSAPSQFAVDAGLIRDGDNDIRIVRKSGKGPIYFAANAKFFSLEEPITPAGNEIFVRRQYYKLSDRPTLLKGFVTERSPLNDGGSVKSGERVETVITVEAKNNYEYLLFEDLKPAGLEAVEVRSGEPLYAYELKSGSVDRKFGTNTSGTNAVAPKTEDKGRPFRRRIPSGKNGAAISRPAPVNDEDHTGRSRWVYQELRDRKVALFIDKLPQGVWEIKYNLRAEVPGQFHALPVMGHAMYVPEIRCNGAEVRIKVEDSK